MPDPLYIGLAIAVTLLVTLGLRALPFGVKKPLEGSALLADLGRWMPLGAVSILALYCLASIDFGGAAGGVPQVAGVAATVGVHLWRRNAVLSIVAGTATCVLASIALPA